MISVEYIGDKQGPPDLYCYMGFISSRDIFTIGNFTVLILSGFSQVLFISYKFVKAFLTIII